MRSAPSAAYIEQTAGRSAARAARRRALRYDKNGMRPPKRTYVLLSLVIVASLAPLYYALLLASSTAADIAQNPIPSLLPQGHLLDNFKRVVSADVDLLHAAWNSVVVSTGTAVAVVLLSVLAGFAFARLRFRGRSVLLLFVVGTMAVPTQLGVVPLFMVMRSLGLTGSLWAVFLPGIASAFGVFWMTQYLSAALPPELIEAARIDGATTFRIFRSIVFPAALPAASMLGLFTFVGSWTNYFWPSIVLGSTNPTLPVALQLLQTGFFKDISLIMAGVLVSVVPLLALFVVVGRQLVAGVMQGAVKG